MKLRRRKDGANFIVPIFWATLYKWLHHIQRIQGDKRNKKPQ